ncbi:MAG: dienelactone hydrolase family protein [Planctomycetes bacterium]|nr:dienelactone hydrolase family protein [Planctomycetota bacterium]
MTATRAQVVLGDGATLSTLSTPAVGARRESTVLFAHGAELDFDSEFMREVAELLAARGFDVLRFRYPYMEKRETERKKFPPDRMPKLEDAHFRVLASVRERVGAGRILLAGKSMGARVSTHLAAKGADAAALVLFGYPLHPAGSPDEERREHFPAIVQPALFLQGTRDPLCDLAKLERALATYGGHAKVHVVDDADHGFDVPKRAGRTRAQVLGELADAVATWHDAAFPD